MDLLEMLVADELDLDVVHSVMTNFGLACGLDYLTVSRAGGQTILGTREPHSDRVPTCPDCLAAFGDLDGLRAELRRQQTRQAQVVA